MSNFFSSDREYIGRLSMRCSKCDWSDNALRRELSSCPKCSTPLNKSCLLEFGDVTIKYDGIKDRFEIGDIVLYNTDCFDSIIFFMRHFRFNTWGNEQKQKLGANFEVIKDKYKNHKYFKDSVKKHLSVECSKCSWKSNDLDIEIDVCPQCNHSLAQEDWILTFGGTIIRYNYIKDRFELRGNGFNQGYSIIDNADCPDTIEFMLRHLIYYDYNEKFDEIENKIQNNKTGETVFLQEKDVSVTAKEYVYGGKIHPMSNIIAARCTETSIPSTPGWIYIFSPGFLYLIYIDIKLYDYPLYFYIFTFVLVLIPLVLLFLGITTKSQKPKPKYSVWIKFNKLVRENSKDRYEIDSMETWESYDKTVIERIVDAISKAIEYNRQNEINTKAISNRNEEVINNEIKVATKAIDNTVPITHPNPTNELKDNDTSITNKKTVGELIKKVNIYTILRIITIILLFAALFDQSSEYYVALKFVVFCITGYGAYLVYDKKLNQRWLWTFVVIALLFNPFIPVQLDDYDLWAIIDIVVAIILLVSIFKLEKKQ